MKFLKTIILFFFLCIYLSFLKADNNSKTIDIIEDASVNVDIKKNSLQNLNSLTEDEFNRLLSYVPTCEIQLLEPLILKLNSDDIKIEDKTQKINNALIGRIKLNNEDDADCTMKVINLIQASILSQANLNSKESYILKLSPFANIFEEIFKVIPVNKRVKLLDNESFIGLFQTLSLIQEKPTLFTLFFDLYLKTEDPIEKRSLLNAIYSRKELLSDFQLKEFVLNYKQLKDKEIIDISNKLLTELLGPKPANINWEDWLKKNTSEKEAFQKLLNPQLSFEERRTAYSKLCRMMVNQKGDKIFNDQLLQSILKIIYDNNENLKLRIALFFQLLPRGNDIAEGKTKDDGIVAKTVEKLLKDFMNNPDFHELYGAAHPNLFASDEMKRRLSIVADDPKASRVCRAGAIWQLALNTRGDWKALKKYAYRLLDLFSDDFKKGIKGVDEDPADSKIANHLLWMTAKDKNLSHFYEKELNFKNFSEAVASMRDSWLPW